MTQRKTSGIGPKTIRWIWVVAFAPFVLVGVMLLLTAFGVFGRMPSFEELENPRSNLATEIYSEDGKVLGTFFVQNRSYVQYADLFPSDSTLHIRLDGHDVPPIVAALVATEDVRFRSHSGIDIPSLARVAVKTVLLQNTSQGGGSTITQQLAKNLFPRDTARNRSRVARTAKLVTSKFKEWITALKLEYNYTKEEIAAMYLNTVGYGSNAYGIKAAAHTFFNKEPDELNVQEAAVLVGVVNAPTRYSPVRNPDNALARRNLVLSRMAEAGALTRGQCDSISALPIVLNYKPVSHNEGIATYFREMLRLEAYALVQALHTDVAGILIGVAEEGMYRGQYMLQKQVGVGWHYSEIGEREVTTFVGHRFTESSAWRFLRPLTEAAYDGFDKSVMLGEPVSKMEARIGEAKRTSIWRSKREARTTITEVSNDAHMEEYKRAKAKRYQFVATFDEKTCPVCGQLDGKTFNIEDAEPGVNYPPMHPNCRCTTVAVLSKEILALMAPRQVIDYSTGQMHEVPQDFTYEDWYKTFGPGRTDGVEYVPKYKNRR